VLAQFESPALRSLPRETAEDLIHILRGAIDRGTGQAVRTQFGIRADVAGKTGTTQDNTDGWFILMHPQLVAGAWVGFNDPRVTLRSAYWGQGAHNALPVVADFFRQALNTRWLDAEARFPRTHESFLDSLIDRIEGWFGLHNPPSPSRDGRDQPADGPLDVLDRAADGVRETLGVYERMRRWLDTATGDRGKVEAGRDRRDAERAAPPEAERRPEAERQREQADRQREMDERARNAR
jgi:penicillin-binding protein 1A